MKHSIAIDYMSEFSQNNVEKKKRTKSGCLTCRDRHIKCDEDSPVCKNCVKSKRKCFRGIRFKFVTHAVHDTDTSGSLKLKLKCDSSKNNKDISKFNFSDQSIMVSSFYSNGVVPCKPYLQIHRLDGLENQDFDLKNKMHFTNEDMNLKITSKDKKKKKNFILKESGLDNDKKNNNFSRHKDSSFVKNIMVNSINNCLFEDSFFDNSEIEDYKKHQNYYNFKEMEDFLENFFKLKNLKVRTVFELENLIFNKLIKNEQIFFLFDLFNDLNLLKFLVPKFCLLDLVDSKCTDFFLISCLLNCFSEFNFEFESLLKQQLVYWNIIYSINKIKNNLKFFQKFLLSIALILINILNKYDVTNFNLFFDLTLNQFNMFNFIICKFKTDLFLLKFNCKIILGLVQTIITLKYFTKNILLYNLKRTFKHNFNAHKSKNNHISSYLNVNLCSSPNTINENSLYFDLFDINCGFNNLDQKTKTEYRKNFSNVHDNRNENDDSDQNFEKISYILNSIKVELFDIELLKLINEKTMISKIFKIAYHEKEIDSVSLNSILINLLKIDYSLTKLIKNTTCMDSKSNSFCFKFLNFKNESYCKNDNSHDTVFYNRSSTDEFNCDDDSKKNKFIFDRCNFSDQISTDPKVGIFILLKHYIYKKQNRNNSFLVDQINMKLKSIFKILSSKIVFAWDFFFGWILN